MINRTYYIYLVKSPSNKFYVGITYNLNRRMSSHKFRAKSGSNLPLYNAMRKYGSAMEWSIIDQADSWESASEKEKMYIQKYDSYLNGYNSTLGGDGTVGFFLSEETKQKQSKIKDKFKKSVLCHQNGKIYESLSDAARDLGLYYGNITKVLKGKRMSTCGYTFTEVGYHLQSKK